MSHRERVGFGLVCFALLIAQLSCGDSSGPGLVASSITANSSTTQTAPPGAEVAEPPSVIVRDQNGGTLSGVSVTFAVTAGGGSVTGGTATTDASGVATVGSWTLGTAEGANTLTASSGNVHLTFTATAFDPCVVSATHSIGGTTNGELTPASDCKFSDGSFVDFIGTTLTAAGTYLFSQSSATFDTFLALYGSNGIPIGFNDDFGSGHDSRIKAILPAGNYVLGANGYDRTQFGAYTLTSATNGGPVGNCEEVFVVRGVTTTQNLDATDCARVGGYYGDQLLIFVVAGQAISVSMTSTAVDAYINIYDPNNVVVASNDNRDGTTTDAQLTYTPTITGFYSILPTSANVGGTGSYTVVIQ